MGTFLVELENGSKYKVEADKQPTNEELQSYLSGGAQEQDVSSPATPAQRALVSIPKSGESKKKLLLDMNFKDVEELPDGSFMISGRPLDPKPTGFASFLRDFAGDLGDMVGPSMPTIFQIAADVAASPSIASGPGAIPAFAAANAVGAGTGEALRQGLSQQLTGEEPSLGGIAFESGAGAVGGAVGASLSPVTKVIQNRIAKFMQPIVKKVGNSFPAIGETMFNVPKVKGQYLVDQVNLGRSVSDVIGGDIAEEKFATEVARRTLYGHKNADEGLKELGNNFRNMYFKALPKDRPSIVDMYRRYTGLSSEAIERFVTKSPADLLKPENTSREAFVNLGRDTLKATKEFQNKLSSRYSSTLNKVMQSRSGSRTTANIDDIISNLMKELDINNPTGVGVLDSDILNQGYTGKAAKEIYSELFGKLAKFEKLDIEQAISKGGVVPKDLFVRGELNPKLSVKQISLNNKPLSLINLHKKLRELDPLLDKAFNILSDTESRPLAQFLSALRQRLGKASPKIAELNRQWESMNDIKRLFKGLNERDISNVDSAISVFKKYLKDPNQRVLLEGPLSILDANITGRKIIPRIKDIGVAQELADLDPTAPIKSMLDDMEKLFGKSRDSELAFERLSRFDNSIRQPGLKFMREAMDHSVAKGFNHPQHFFRTRALYLMLAGGFGGLRGGAAGAVGMATALTKGTPKNIASMLGSLRQAKVPSRTLPKGTGTAIRAGISQTFRSGNDKD